MKRTTAFLVATALIVGTGLVGTVATAGFTSEPPALDPNVHAFTAIAGNCAEACLEKCPDKCPNGWTCYARASWWCICECTSSLEMARLV